MVIHFDPRMSDSGDEGDMFGLFEEPKEYYKPVPEPTFSNHTLKSLDVIELRLVGNNPLWVRKNFYMLSYLSMPHI